MGKPHSLLLQGQISFNFHAPVQPQGTSLPQGAPAFQVHTFTSHRDRPADRGKESSWGKTGIWQENNWEWGGTAKDTTRPEATREWALRCESCTATSGTRWQPRGGLLLDGRQLAQQGSPLRQVRRLALHVSHHAGKEGEEVAVIHEEGFASHPPVEHAPPLRAVLHRQQLVQQLHKGGRGGGAPSNAAQPNNACASPRAGDSSLDAGSKSQPVWSRSKQWSVVPSQHDLVHQLPKCPPLGAKLYD